MLPTLKALKERRDSEAVAASLEKISRACREEINVMPALIEGAKAYCTLGEMTDVMREVFGIYREVTVF